MRGGSLCSQTHCLPFQRESGHMRMWGEGKGGDVHCRCLLSSLEV